jgi:hypothetical protein
MCAVERDAHCIDHSARGMVRRLWCRETCVSIMLQMNRGLKGGSRRRGPGSGVRGPGSGVRGPGSGVRGPGSGVRGPGSGVRRWQSSGLTHQTCFRQLPIIDPVSKHGTAGSTVHAGIFRYTVDFEKYVMGHRIFRTGPHHRLQGLLARPDRGSSTSRRFLKFPERSGNSPACRRAKIRDLAL